MLNRAKPSWLLLITCCLGGVPPASAQVDDRAGLFSTEAVKVVNTRLEKMRNRLGKGFLLDTFKEVPAAEADKRHRFFSGWAQRRIRETKLEGVHVAVCLAPHYVEVTVTSGVEELFRPWSQEHLQRYLQYEVKRPPAKPATKKGEEEADWRDKNDSVLREVVSYVETKFTANREVGRVLDEAGLFKQETIERADRQIKEIRQRFGKDLTIATVRAAPRIDTLPYNLNNAGQKREFLDDWMRDSVVALDGIYVLICLDPTAIRVSSEGTNFTERNRHQLYELLVDYIQPENPDQGVLQGIFSKLKKKRDNDRGLLAAVDFVEAKLSDNRPVEMAAWLFGMGAIGAFLGVWMLLGMMRMRLRRTTPADAGVHDADDSGRSIAVLGGGVGAVCGEWLFGKVFSAGRGVAQTVMPPTKDHAGDSGTRLRLEDLQQDSLRHDVNNEES